MGPPLGVVWGAALSRAYYVVVNLFSLSEIVCIRIFRIIYTQKEFSRTQKKHSDDRVLFINNLKNYFLVYTRLNVLTGAVSFALKVPDTVMVVSLKVPVPEMLPPLELAPYT